MKRDVTHALHALAKACERLSHASVAITRAHLATSVTESDARPYLNEATNGLLASLRLLAGVEQILQDLDARTGRRDPSVRKRHPSPMPVSDRKRLLSLESGDPHSRPVKRKSVRKSKRSER
jgi:hypothetical protein